MGILIVTDPGTVMAEAATGFTLGMIKVLGSVALAILAVGFIMSVLCDFCECRKLRRARGRTGFWRLMHTD